MLNVPTYQSTWHQNRAQDASEARYPGLWKGVALNLQPGLGPTGLTLHDLSGRGNNGTLIGMDPATDWVNDGRWALDFDEVNNHVLVPDFSYGPHFTLSFWFFASDLSGPAYQYIFSYGALSTQNSINIFFTELGLIPTGQLRTSFLDSNDSADSGLDVDVNFEDGLWHLYILVVGSFGSRVYVDGTFRSAIANGGDAFNPTTDIFLGGREDLNPGRFFNGRMDDKVLRDGVVFTASQAQLLYQLGRGGWLAKRQRVFAKALAAPSVISVGRHYPRGVGRGIGRGVAV